MISDEIIEWEPTEALRWYTPDARYVPETLQRQFVCKFKDGSTSTVWARVFVESPFVRVAESAKAKGE